mmetsp:Transcript_18456/g.8599  ORF Transcript_18456/g.8599 Transcript_18456/m.8599 type:complete len:212 (+) Transcript_18456:399-1034(+)
MADLEATLQKSQGNRMRWIVTDGVFSMDGDLAPLRDICDLADKYDAYIYIDDAHATGLIGAHGRGTPEFWEVEGRIDVISSTLGKALGGATGGYLTGRAEIIELMRQRARPYLFSNSLAPCIVGASLKVFELLQSGSDYRDRLNANTTQFRKRMKQAGFTIGGHDVCPIAPVMLGDAKLATEFANEMMKEGIYVIGFSYPVVPVGKARIRV